MLVRGTLALTHMYSVKVGQDGFCLLSEVCYSLRMPAATVMSMARPTYHRDAHRLTLCESVLAQYGTECHEASVLTSVDASSVRILWDESTHLRQRLQDRQAYVFSGVDHVCHI